MEQLSYWQACLLGIVEGLTEFLPVSSTGHLIMLIDLLKVSTTPGKSFEVVIQLGAILAVCYVYRARLWHILRGLVSPIDAKEGRSAWKFSLNILLAFLPSVIVGLLAYSFIKHYLFSPLVVSVSLLVGGIIILLIEYLSPRIRCYSLDDISWKRALIIGCCQVLAMIPGVSRSGATIMGAYAFGTDRKTATEFSFFLAIPTMMAATLYDLYKNYAVMQFTDSALIATGFVTAFVTALLAVRLFLHYVSSHSFRVFAYYRILVGSAMLGWVYF